MLVIYSQFTFFYPFKFNFVKQHYYMERVKSNYWCY